MGERYCVGIAMAVDWEDDGNRGFDKRLARRALACFRPYWRAAALAAACLVAGAALGLVPALVFKELIDYLAAPDEGFRPVALLVGASVAAALAGGLIGLAQSYLSERISQGIIFDLRGDVFDSLLHQSIGFYTGHRGGEVLSRIGNDVNGIEDVVADTLLGLLRNVIVAVSTLALMLAFDWRLTLAALLIIPAAALPMRHAGRKVYEAQGRVQRKLSEMTAYLQEVLGISGAMLVKAFTAERAERERFRRQNDDLRGLEIRVAMIRRWFGMAMDVLETLGPGLLILFGGYLIITGRTTVGTVFVFATVLMQRFGMAVGSLGETHVNLTGSLALFRRIFAVIDHPPEVADRPGARPLAHPRGAVRFEAVTFAYPGQAQPALREVSAAVEPGQLVALVGPSGAGKTTFCSLVPRFADPQAGRVLVDGHDVRELTLESLRGHVGVVFQDTFLFHASIRDNLLYARPNASEAELEAAVRAAHLHELMAALPDGLDTVVGERGHRLSGGEKQRVAIARVVLKDPRILVLDEATSNLDTVSEQLIQAALQPLLAARTSLVIAHRLSTILAADKILVLDRGRLVEEGGHADLLAAGGLYATLYERQFRGQPESAAASAA